MSRIGRTFSIIAIAAFCAGISPLTNAVIHDKIIAENKLLLGDVCTDGKVDASDATLILVEYTAISVGGKSTFTESQTETADVNGDGIIDASDVSLVLSYYGEVSTGNYISMEEYIYSPVLQTRQ